MAMDVGGPLPKTKSGNQHELVFMDRYRKPTRSIPVVSVTSTAAATVSVENWIMRYDIPTYLLTDNGPQFDSKFFAAICVRLGLKHLTMTAYHLQTNGQVKRFNQTIAGRLRQYVAEHQTDWDLYVQPLTYAHNAQVHKSTCTTPFSLTLSQQPAGPTTSNQAPVIPDNMTEPPNPLSIRSYFLRQLDILHKQTDSKIAAAKARYKRNFDRIVREGAVSRPGQSVFIDGHPTQMTESARQLTSCCRN